MQLARARQQRRGGVLKQQFGQQKEQGGGDGYILTYQAEDFQVPNATRASFVASKSEMSPTGNNDCESSSHAVASNYLSFVEMCGISDTPLRKVDMRKVCQQLELHIFNSDSKFVFDGGNEARVQLQQQQAGPMYYPEFEQWVMANKDKMSQMEQYKYGLAAFAAFLSSRNFFVDQVMGGAYGASAEDPHKKELGGHSYLIMGIKESRAGGRVLHSSISEQTVYALPRMHTENKTQVKQIMQAEKGLSAAIGQLLFNDRESAKIKPMVQMANKEHTEDFYGDLFVTSHVQPYCKLVDIGRRQEGRERSYGAYAFTVVNGVKMFGVQPEHAHSRGAQYIEVCGQDVDKQMARGQYQCGSGVAATAAKQGDKPFTDSVRQCVLARREMSPGVVSKQDWCIWQQRMWGFDLRSQTATEGRQAVPFSAPGKVARVIISGKDQKEVQAIYTKARELASPAGVAKLKAFVASLRDQFLTSSSNATTAADESAQSICLLSAVLKNEAVDCIRVSRGLNAVIVSVMCTGAEGSFCSGDVASLSTAKVYENHFATCPLILAKMFAEPGLFKQGGDADAALAATPALRMDAYQKYCAEQTQREQQRLLASRRYCFGPISRETGLFRENDIWMHADACQTCIFTTAADMVADILSKYGGAKRIIDASPGAGEMSYAFSKKFASVEAIISGEQKQQGEFLVHNLSKMHCANIKVLESKAAAAAAAAVAGQKDDTVVFCRHLAVGQPEGSFSVPVTGGTLALALPISVTKPDATAVGDMILHAHHCIYLNFAHIFNLYIYTNK